jgi:hypothetical protein
MHSSIPLHLSSYSPLRDTKFDLFSFGRSLLLCFAVSFLEVLILYASNSLGWLSLFSSRTVHTGTLKWSATYLD